MEKLVGVKLLAQSDSGKGERVDQGFNAELLEDGLLIKAMRDYDCDGKPATHDSPRVPC